jgi:hypothetical protein
MVVVEFVMWCAERFARWDDRDEELSFVQRADSSTAG